MKFLISIIALITVLESNCRKSNNLSEDIPKCIKIKIKELQNKPVQRPPASVWEFEYNGKKVYYIPADCCDRFNPLYDKKCNIICHPDGGITGKGDGKCLDFSRKNEKLIWKDDRKHEN